jgi:lysophospholipase L1-like esterase
MPLNWLPVLLCLEVLMSRFLVSISAAAAFLALFSVSALAAAAGPASASVALPNSMAATGDSITTAFDVDWAGVLQSSPQDSWSTGTNSAVDSEYTRILAANPAIKGHEYNDAVPGATMADLDGQVSEAASQGVQYLTVEMGANDLCMSSVGGMTPTATFQSEFQQALTDFTSADPGADIFVASIPNIYRLWQDEHGDFVAELEWNVFGICSDMLSVTATSAQRQQIVAQEQADNQALANVCAEFSQCRFDNDAVYDVSFSSADISDVDYFHPSVAGQAELAAVAWSAGFWPGTN